MKRVFLIVLDSFGIGEDARCGLLWRRGKQYAGNGIEESLFFHAEYGENGAV